MFSLSMLTMLTMASASHQVNENKSEESEMRNKIYDVYV